MCAAHLLAAAAFITGILPVRAAVHYVDVSNLGAAAPYSSWATAANSIQAAIDAALDGDEIVVTNGVYQTGGRVVYGTLSNRVAVTRPLTLRSVNGPLVTVIQGYQVPGVTNGDGAVRCVYMTNGAKLSGFTLTNGATRAVNDVGGREGSGGGMWCESQNTVMVSNCVMTGNAAYNGGGGAYSGTLNTCTLTGNSAGAGGAAYSSFLNNCGITGNSASYGGGVFYGILKNCTITGNSARNIGGVVNAVLNNCILYYNSDILGWGNHEGSDPAVWQSNIFNYCCTTPLPPSGEGNFTIEPQLISASHIASTSPCRAAGNPGYASGLDIDGQPWASRPSVGCDEFYTGDQSGPLTVAITANFLNVATGFEVSFTAQINGNPSASAWDFGDGTVVSNKVYLRHGWQTPGQYGVVLRAYNQSYPAGLSATTMVQVVAQPVHYVAMDSSNPVAPYSSWDTAATVIQDAVDAADVVGALVLVSNGVYQTGGRVVTVPWNSRVAATIPLMLRSVNGPEVTVIDGNSAGRCVYLGSDATLSGFTVTNGATGANDTSIHEFGAGVWCQSRNAVVTNCILSGNDAGYAGGGATYSGTINNCTLSHNRAQYGAGAYGGALNNCVLTENMAFLGEQDGVGGGAIYATLNNCTVISNGAYYAGGQYRAILNNCVVYYNLGVYDEAFGGNNRGGSLNYCCTTPLPSTGVGNFTNAPQLMNGADGNPRLQPNSPCINSGFNGYAPAGTDLDGHARIAGGTVDVGAYEFQSPASAISYAWLQRYGFPIDGSADPADPDGDHFSNYREWRAGTGPTDAASVLRLRGVSLTGPDLVVTWASVTGRTYYLEASSNLCSTACFERVGNNIPGRAGTTTYTHAQAAGTIPYFYRVGVEEQ